MRKKILIALISVYSICVSAQDSLKTSTLEEVVFTGTKYELPVEKSGKTITKLTTEDLERNAGKTLSDILNEIPGLQMDGNFSAPGANVSYYVRGGRNRNTLILIDGVPLNDPSAINAEYDLRYIPVSQIESIEVLKGGLSTLYGTGAAAGVINIKLKSPSKGKVGGTIDVNAASYNTFSQSAQVGGTLNRFTYLVSSHNIDSEGFSAAEDNDEAKDYDRDGFSRQNGLVKLGYKFSEKFNLDFQSAYEQFEADYDAYEFTDADYKQKYHQYRLGLLPTFLYKKGEFNGKIFYNVNNRKFESNFPSEFEGRNLQAELTHRHQVSEVLQALWGINYQRLAYEQKNAAAFDTTHFAIVDPYASLTVDLPTGLNVHAGIRLNTHSVYGSKVIYNLNPSFLLNKNGTWRYKILASVATSYITPSLYQIYSFYGNQDLKPEEALNYEAGFSTYRGDKLNFNIVWFQREESSIIDFVSLYDNNGDYIGGQYKNTIDNRIVYGVELSTSYQINAWLNVAANYSHMDTDKATSFYKIPKNKYGFAVNVQPLPSVSISSKYNYTGERKIFDYSSFAEVALKNYQLIDIFASYSFNKYKLSVYGAINNLLDEKFVAVYGYTTRGRNYSGGIRYKF